MSLLIFRIMKEEKSYLTNDTGCGGPFDPEKDAKVMQFRVNQTLREKDIERYTKPFKQTSVCHQNKIFKRFGHLKLVGSQDEYGRPMFLLTNRMWDDPVTEKPA